VGEHYQLAGTFADGAGAVLLEASEEMGIEASARATLPEHCENVLAYNDCMHASPSIPTRKLMFCSEDGVARAFATLPRNVAKHALEKAGAKIEDIRWLVSHQPRADMLEILARQLNIPPERHYINLDKYGNTSSASIPICL